MAAKKGKKTIFEKKNILGVKNFVDIALSRTVSKIDAFLLFMQKFKMAAKHGGTTNFEKGRQLILQTPQGVNNFIKIALSHTVSEIIHF